MENNKDNIQTSFDDVYENEQNVQNPETRETALPVEDLPVAAEAETQEKTEAASAIAPLPTADTAPVAEPEVQEKAEDISATTSQPVMDAAQVTEPDVQDKAEEASTATGQTSQIVAEPEKETTESNTILSKLEEALRVFKNTLSSGVESGKDYVEAKKTEVVEKTEAKKAEWEEKKQQTLDAIAKNKEERVQEFERRKQAFEHTTAELSDRMKQLLSGEILAMEKQKKTRGVEIMAVFAKHNFYANGFTPVEMRTTLEDLGPTYVKIGQIISSRVDLLPESYCKELEKLRQNVKELDPQIARAVIEEETGKTIDEIYLEFRDKPLGSASIGQAHYGVLKDGTRVVTKVQRPLIADMMREDFVLLKKLGGLVSSIGGDDEDGEQTLDLVSVIEELEKVTEEELDFRIEAENTKFFKENCIEDEDKITCPTVIDELTTERIFTMTYVDGYSISKKDRLIEEGYDPEQIGSVILDNYLHQVLDVGTFHGDPHQGNLMISYGKPVWIDFGMIGRISDSDVNILQSLILSMINRDMDTLVNSIMSLGAASPKTDRNKLMEDADVMLEKYMNVTNLAELDLSLLLGEVMDLTDKHHISLPGKYTMLVRSIATIEGVIEQLCPELNLFQQITDKLIERVKKNFDVGKELLSTGKDLLNMGTKVSKMPGLAYDALNSMVKGRMKLNFELTGYEEIMDRLDMTVQNLILALFSCVLFIGSCMLSSTDIQPKSLDGQPIISAAGMILSFALAIFTVKRMSKKK